MKAASLLVAVVCLCATSIAAGFQSHRVGGQVVDMSGDPLVGVNVSLQLDGVPLSTSTNQGGYFQVGDLPAGVFLVEFSLNGYETIHEWFQLGAGRLEQFTSIVLNPRYAQSRTVDGDHVVDVGQVPREFLARSARRVREGFGDQSKR